jgi:spermidine synthase
LQIALLISVFVVASCGLAYELVAAALASYVLGDSITQFSTIIGTYLFAMGVGSYLSRFVVKGLTTRFIQVELAVGVIGGFSAIGLFLAFAWLHGPFRALLYGTVMVVGTLVGLEIPVIMRLLKDQVEFKDLVSKVLSFDYLGALAVSVLFPVILAPHLGLARTGLLFGLMNIAVALWAIHLFRHQLGAARGLKVQGVVALLAVLAGFIYADKLTSLAEQSIYSDTIIHAETSPYQRIVVTKWKDDTRLFLNGNLQFSSRDEYRYHEALVHPAMAAHSGPRRVLVLGGGDGLAVREVLKYPQVSDVTLVDLDAKMTGLFSRSPALVALNNNALLSPKVKIVNSDALVWLEKGQEPFDVIIIDFPDPSNFSLGKLYSTAFYRLIDKHLAPQGIVVIQSTSPLYARKSYWTVVRTLEEAGFSTAPYHAFVPSFGEWGFIIASRSAYRAPERFPVATRFLTPEINRSLFLFPPDMARVDMEPNRLNNQVLVRIFEEEWRRVIR